MAVVVLTAGAGAKAAAEAIRVAMIADFIVDDRFGK
jgi:thiazole synthase ThiGH ThiG subunit